MPKTRYLFIGQGRLSNHLSFYFRSLGLQAEVWSRRSQTPLAARLQNVDRVLIALKDDEIENFYDHNPAIHTIPSVHFSGRVTHPKIYSAHPLMTFSEELYDINFYSKIPFITERGRPNFSKLFPDLKNPNFEIYAHQKTQYHALCAMAGNFAQVLWAGVQAELAAMNLPPTVMGPYLTQVTKNFITHGKSSLTGPLSRGDHQTIAQHLSALHGSDLQALYYAFLQFFNTQARKNITEGTTHESPTI